MKFTRRHALACTQVCASYQPTRLEHWAPQHNQNLVSVPVVLVLQENAPLPLWPMPVKPYHVLWRKGDDDWTGSSGA